MGDAMKPFPNVEVRINVPFHDVDLMEIVWHGHYAKYFEVARCALLEKIAYNYQQMKESGYAWPIIELKTRYIKPATFGQDIVVRARRSEEHTSELQSLMRISYAVFCLTKKTTQQHSHMHIN